jgi:hypothetical protein
MDTTIFFFLFPHILFRRIANLISIGLSRLGRTWLGVLWRCTVPFFCLEVVTAEQLICISLPTQTWLTCGQSSVADSIVISNNDESRQQGDYSHSV